VIKPRRIGWASHVAHIEEMKNAYEVLVMKFQGKRSDGIPRCRCNSNIIMYFKEVRWEMCVDWIQWAQDHSVT
jgi:hypothetical protein